MNAIATLTPPAAPAGPAKQELLYEIVNGVRVELPSMGAYANWIALGLARLLGSFVDPRALGTIAMETLFILDPVRDIRRRPDVALVSAQKWPPDQPPPEIGDWQIVPDLAVEVVSPNDVFQEVLNKMEEYFRLGVGQVWIIVPSRRQIYLYDSPTTSPRVLNADQELDGGPLLPGLRLPVGSLFQRQAPAAPAVP